MSLTSVPLRSLRCVRCVGWKPRLNNGRMYGPCLQSCVRGPTQVVPLQTRCHDCDVLLQLTVVRSPVLSTHASAGASRLAQPSAAASSTQPNISTSSAAAAAAAASVKKVEGDCHFRETGANFRRRKLRR